MRVSCPHLHGGVGDPDHEFWLIHRTDALAFTHVAEYEVMKPWDASRALRRERFEDFQIDRFLNHVASGNSLFDPRSRSGRARTDLQQLVEQGELVVLRRPPDRALDLETQTVQAERALARELAGLQRTAHLILGRPCILVSRADHASVPNRDRYQVVGNREATVLLAQAAAATGVSVAARKLLENVTALLAPDWHPPRQPNGMVLLRELPRVVASQNPEPAITPAQLRALMQSETEVHLQVVVLDLDDSPLNNVHYTIAAPDNTDYDADFGAGGTTKITSAKKGPVMVTLAWVEAAAQAS